MPNVHYLFGAIIFNEGHLLLVQRSPTARSDFEYRHESRVWSRPVGIIPAHVTGANVYGQALEYMVPKELGIEVDIFGNRRFRQTSDTDRKRKSQWLIGEKVAFYSSGKLQNLKPNKHSKVKWFKIEKLPENLEPGTRAALEALVR